MQTKAVLFDLDGTILDTLGDLREAVNHAMRTHGYPEHTLAEIRSYIGNGVRLLVTRAMAENADDADSCLADFMQYYNEHMDVYTKPYEGIAGLMDELRGRGIKVGVVSNKFNAGVQKLVGCYFDGRVDGSIGMMEGMKAKPAPDTAEMLMEQMRIERENVVYVGDSGVDLETAANLGVPCVAVSWGFWDEDRLKAAGAKTIARNTDELKEKLFAILASTGK